MSSQVLRSQALPSQFRGLYHRVAKRLGVDPSYVSRVARQERQSEAVSAELKKEVARILSVSRAVLAESVLAQLDLALTFCKHARKAVANGDGANGCIRCARQAADCAFKFMGKLNIEPGEYEPMKAKAERLRFELHSLGRDLRQAGDNGTTASDQTVSEP